jgi:cysteine desulfurase
MSERVYFDWNASAPLRDEARAAFLRALDARNASSVHAEGRTARGLIEAARDQVAQAFGAQAQDVIFTSGATEANMLALTPALEGSGIKGWRDRLFVSGVEHPSVLCGGRFPDPQVERLAVECAGLVDLEALRVAIGRAERPLVSVMLANNETGVVQPVAAIAAIVHGAGGLLHVDAAQGPGRLDCSIAALGADLMTISSHKLGGPQGAGALIWHNTGLGDIHIAEPLIRGGGQERSRRAGTENVAAIAGFGAAAEAAATAVAAEAAHMARLRGELEAGLKAATPGVVIFSAGVERLPNTTLFAVPGMKAETAVIAFDLNGIAVSSGAACSSGKVAASHVLAAMGVEPELARGAVRVSLGPASCENEVERFLETWIMLAGSLVKERQGLAA